MPRVLLAVILVILLLAVLPTWPYSSGWGYYPSGGLGLLLLIIIILILAKPSLNSHPGLPAAREKPSIHAHKCVWPRFAFRECRKNLITATICPRNLTGNQSPEAPASGNTRPR